MRCGLVTSPQKASPAHRDTERWPQARRCQQARGADKQAYQPLELATLGALAKGPGLGQAGVDRGLLQTALLGPK